MTKTFKEMLVEKLERITEARIDGAFANGYNDIAARTTRAQYELKEIKREYETALKWIEDNSNEMLRSLNGSSFSF